MSNRSESSQPSAAASWKTSDQRYADQIITNARIALNKFHLFDHSTIIAMTAVLLLLAAGVIHFFYLFIQ